MRKIAKLIVVVLLASALISVVIASYQMQSSDIAVTVTKRQSIGISASAPEIVEGETVTLSAKVSDSRNGIVVSFYQNGTLCGQATTLNGGVASLTITPPEGTHYYFAKGLHP